MSKLRQGSVTQWPSKWPNQPKVSDHCVESRVFKFHIPIVQIPFMWSLLQTTGMQLNSHTYSLVKCSLFSWFQTGTYPFLISSATFQSKITRCLEGQEKEQQDNTYQRQYWFKINVRKPSSHMPLKYLQHDCQQYSLSVYVKFFNIPDCWIAKDSFTPSCECLMLSVILKFNEFWILPLRNLQIRSHLKFLWQACWETSLGTIPWKLNSSKLCRNVHLVIKIRDVFWC